MTWNGSNGEVIHPKKKSKKKASLFVVICSALAIVGIGAMICGTLFDGNDTQSEIIQKRNRLQKHINKGKRNAKEVVRSVLPANLPRKQSKKRRVNDIEMFAHLKGEDRKLAVAVQCALDSEDFKKTVAAATAALASDNPEVRINAVDALGWFGAQALPELTGAMADSDEDVRNAAENHFEIALSEVEKLEDQLKIAMAAFSTLNDVDQLSTLGGIVNNAATEFIDGEDNPDKANENRIVVLQSLVDIIDDEKNTPQNIAAAKELYNDITGYEWESIDEAEKYLSDPENYDPDKDNVSE